MAFADRISGDVGILWYARISGIPYVFSNATLPASWLTAGNVVIDGETYTPSKTLIMRDGMSVEQTIQPKQGIASSSGQTFVFELDATWLDLISTQLYRSGSNLAYVIDSVDVDDVIIPCDDVSAWPATGVVYSSTETIAYGARSGVSFTSATRGRYGSQALPVLADGETLLNVGAFGAVVADHPLVWHDRIVQLWCATGTWENDGTFTPFGATIESTEDQRVYRGVISGLEVDRDLQRVELKVQPLDSLLERQVAWRLPELDMGPGVGGSGRLVAYDDASNDIVGLIRIESEQVTFSNPVQDDSRLNVAPASVLVKKIVANMRADILAASPAWLPAAGNNVLGASVSVDADGVLTIIFVVTVTATEIGKAFLVIDPTSVSVWRALGFEETKWVTWDLTIGGNQISVPVTADRPLPQLYIPGNDTLGDLFWTTAQGPPFQSPTDWRTRTNASINAHVLVDDEIIEVGEATTTTTLYGVDVTSAPIIRRGALGTVRREHYIEQGDDPPVGMQVIGLPGSFVADAWLYLLCGGSGVAGFADAAIDRGWRGSGAYIPLELVDTASFFGLRADRRWISDNLAVTKSERLSEILQGGLIGQAYAIVAGADKIRAVDVIPPTISDASIAVMALDHSNTRTIGADGVGLDLSERRIINSLEISSGLDNATGEYTQQHPAKHTWSIGTWGEREPLRMLLRALSAAAVTDSFALEIAEVLLAAFGTPYAVLEVEVSDPLWWTVRPGDIVTLTNDLVPTVSNGISLVTVGRGITALPARVMATRRDYPSDSSTGTDTRGRATLVVANIDGAQTCNWSPTARCTAVSADELTIAANEYSESGGSADASRFANGDNVILRTYDGGTRYGPYEVDSVSSNTIFLTTTPPSTPTAPFLVEAVQYSSAVISSAQKINAFMADSDHKLDLSSGSDPPRRYR